MKNDSVSVRNSSLLLRYAPVSCDPRGMVYFALEGRTHVVGECEMCKQERDVLEEEMREICKCDMEKFGILDSSEKTVAILGDRRTIDGQT